MDGTQAVEALYREQLSLLDVAMGDEVAEGQPAVVMEAMKMEHVTFPQ